MNIIICQVIVSEITRNMERFMNNIPVHPHGTYLEFFRREFLSIPLSHKQQFFNELLFQIF